MVQKIGLVTRALVSQRDVELFYEGLLLKTVTSFEALLEELFLSLLTGSVEPVKRVHPRVTFRSAAVARSVVLGGRAYVNWLPYYFTENRAKAFFRGGQPFTSLDKADKRSLEDLQTIRNAVAHQSLAAKDKFKREILAAVPLLPRERSPSGFLRSVFRTNPPQTRYEEIAANSSMISRKLCT